MILGIEKAVSELCVGAVATVTVPSEIAYGQMGLQPHIMDNEDVIVSIEVLRADPPSGT